MSAWLSYCFSPIEGEWKHQKGTQVRMFITGSVDASGVLQPLEGEESSIDILRRDCALDSMECLIENLNINGVFIVVWLDNGLIEVSLMPTK